MSDACCDPQKPQKKAPKPGHKTCACCGPTEYEFPDELLTPELKALKAKMSPEEFEELMKSLM